MKDDINGDEAMENFEDLGRTLFQNPKENVGDEAEEISEEEPEVDE